ncbi:hypothetical protein L1049_013264 [Liquidambar formosana]|uniref:DNA-directed RNA polymerase subunit n=1 Tax=Liquidambar formosana TaxID=63359 RepID=A0AAP0RKX4_LIQFO
MGIRSVEKEKQKKKKGGFAFRHHQTVTIISPDWQRQEAREPWIDGGSDCGRHGFVVAMTGFVTFPVKYQCVVFRPFKGEILEAVVTMVNKMGFFAEAGPVQIFVSNHLIPDDMEFQSGDAPNYTTSDGSVKIQKDSEVRLKIIGTRVDATEIFCIGTIKDDFLGVINDPAST